ncbi:MAG TPA: ATP-binding cassette domain-containing protein [Leptospiraceae bacterium]|nr:ATP-binding cassette domain-containing protein [Leptospiraceae bacterium]HMW04343.1 ATP-binding cassette domain-containing protein [Leptospiraceae bacterium]HMX31087.1 ATP-binding cassette domain-containing protein [Leptospiraceae bacterium]HMY31903.1 ATP-binding cassette domain-containing protein [Leptospiraceae bacterium]HMZ65261.1 ATP-binding cassette domain-containing protein [Leptospiraceae bacterium]
MAYVFKTENLSVGFDMHYPILEDINITLNQGDFACLIGSNGCGKSTFIKTISGVLPKCGGEINIDSKTRISMVPQFKKIQYQYPLTVRDVLLLSEKFSFLKKKEFTKNQMAVIQSIDIESILSLLIRECSGGQLQKVLIARSLLSDANLIFLDEPMDALDSKSKRNITEILKMEIKEKNKSIFIITHNVESSWISEFNRVFVVNDRKIMETKK